MPLYLPHFNLQDYNTLAAPADADFFVSVNNDAELLAALKFARENQLPILVLGGGSNIILRDNFPGLVIHVRVMGKELVNETDDYFYVKAAAGENWSEFVDYCLDNHYWGLENLSLIPGNVGAAPIQNIGAYGVELKDVFEELTAFDIQSGLPVTFTNDGCKFDYRDSIFKVELKDKYIITSVTFRLLKKPQLNIQYPALKNGLAHYQESELTPQLIGDLVCDIRRAKLPDPAIIPNVGSFFKNPIINMDKLVHLQESYPTIVFFPYKSGWVKLAAAWLIDQAGWKGFKGEAAVHDEQALVLTNPGRCKGEVILQLADTIKASVDEKFGVTLELEPRIYP